MTFSPAPKPKRTPRKAPSRPRARNASRKKREFARCYHSEARVKFVKSLPCLVSLDFGTPDHPIDNVHIEGDGAGRKAHYTLIVPLKHRLHVELHNTTREAFNLKYGLCDEDWTTCAADTQRRWEKHAERSGIVLEQQRNALCETFHKDLA